jgi:hypothetical protein
MMTPGARRTFALLVAALMVLTCGSAPRPVEPGTPPQRTLAAVDHVVLITLDGVRWQDVFDGVDADLARRRGAVDRIGQTASDIVPNLSAMSRSGVALGDDPVMVASGPNFVSMPGYVELFEGRAPTRCADNDCSGATTETLLDAVAAASEPGSVAAFTSWPRIAKAVSSGRPGFFVSAGREVLASPGDGPLTARAMRALEAGRHGKPFPGHGDFRPDALTAELALAYLEAYEPRLALIGLGEPDEYGHRGDYGAYLKALGECDAVVGRVRDWADRLRSSGRRVVIWVTADHGRESGFVGHGAHAPESARVWAVAQGDGIAQSARSTPKRPLRLADTAPTLRHLLGASALTGSGAGRVLDHVLDVRADHRLARR